MLRPSAEDSLLKDLYADFFKSRVFCFGVQSITIPDLLWSSHTKYALVVEILIWGVLLL